MQKDVHTMLESSDFKALVAKRGKISTLLMILLFVFYYGYVLLIGFNNPFLAQKIGVSTTLGIPLGVGVIIASWLLTVVYVLWANSIYDPEVKRLRTKLFK